MNKLCNLISYSKTQLGFRVTMVYFERLQSGNAMLFCFGFFCFSTQRTTIPFPPTTSLQNQMFVYLKKKLHPTAACLLRCYCNHCAAQHGSVIRNRFMWIKWYNIENRQWANAEHRFDIEGAIFVDLFSSVYVCVCFKFNKLPTEICVVTKFRVAFYPLLSEGMDADFSDETIYLFIFDVLIFF